MCFHLACLARTCAALRRAPRCNALLVIRVIHSTCWWPPLHPLHMTRPPFHLVLTALRCGGTIVLKMDNAWNMDTIKIMHLCSARTARCARKVGEETNFRPAQDLKMTSPTGFAYMGHAEAITVSGYDTHTHTHTHARTCTLCAHTLYWPGIKESRAQDHDSLTGALLQLHLDGAELTVDDSHHALDLFGRDGPCARLFPQQVHHMGSEFVTCLPGDTETKTAKVSSVNAPRCQQQQAFCNLWKHFDWYSKVICIFHLGNESITCKFFWLKAWTECTVYVLVWCHNRWSHLRI